MICEGQSIFDIIAGCAGMVAPDTWSQRIGYMQPRHILELGTGEGESGKCIMTALSAGSRFTTIDNNEDRRKGIGERLSQWKSDERLTVIDADTTNPNTVKLVVGPVDLLFVDTQHTAQHVVAELNVFQGILEEGAIVIIDDLQHNDMWKFFSMLPYEKAGHKDGQGFLRYKQHMPHLE